VIVVPSLEMVSSTKALTPALEAGAVLPGAGSPLPRVNVATATPPLESLTMPILEAAIGAMTEVAGCP